MPGCSTCGTITPWITYRSLCLRRRRRRRRCRRRRRRRRCRRCSALLSFLGRLTGIIFAVVAAVPSAIKQKACSIWMCAVCGTWIYKRT